MKSARAFLLLAFLGTALLSPAALRAQRVKRTFPAGPDTTIEIRNLHGQVTIHGWDKPRVKVIATPRTNAVEAHFADCSRALDSGKANTNDSGMKNTFIA